jgi:predicted transport protein
MSDIRLFSLKGTKYSELHGKSADLEKPLQSLIENNLTELLGIRFLATEYQTGKTHGGRIDTLGLDENNCPVIIEYKRSVGENVINQGLFYLDWLMDHQGDFTLLVIDKLGEAAADAIDWSGPRLICIAADFTRYDSHAIQQIERNVELVRYRQFDKELLLLELVNAVDSSQKKRVKAKPSIRPIGNKGATDKGVQDYFASFSSEMKMLCDSLDSYILSLGDDVQRKELKQYIAYKRLKNFASIVPTKNQLLLQLHLSPDDLQSLPPNARDVRKIGHWGTGDLQLKIKTQKEVEEAKALIQFAYLGL